jgi:hypothetical protein
VEENWVKVMVETVKKYSNFRLEEIRSNWAARDRIIDYAFVVDLYLLIKIFIYYKVYL